MSVPSRADIARLQTRARESQHRAAPVALFVITLLAYLATLTQVHTFDALSYVTSVEHKPWTEVFHPHHLAYGPLGALALALGWALGYTGGAALPMQVLNATAGALGVALFFAIARRLTGRGEIALAVALLLGGSYAYWYYAVEIEVYTVAALFLIVCLDLLTQPTVWSSRRQLFGLGLAQGGAILFHQTNVLLCAPAAIALLGYAWAERRTANDERQATDHGLRTTDSRRWSLVVGGWSTYALALALTVGLPYLFVGIVVSGFGSWGDFEAWLVEYARTGWWGGPITAQKWVSLGSGLTETLAQPGGALLWLLLIGLMLIYLRSLARAPRPLVAALVGWLLVYGAFFLWWEPDNVEFWIASLPPALLLLALALRGERPWGPAIWLALAVATTAAGVNYDAIERRGDPTNDLQRLIARELAARSQPSDLLLVPDGLIELYLPYYEHHDTFLSLNQALFDADGDWERACAAVRTRVDTALHAGASVLVADEVLRPPELLLRRHQLSATQVNACFAPYGGDLQFLPLPQNVPAYWRLPPGREYAQGLGWHFDRFAVGWRAENVGQERFEQEWRFVPASDPALISPLLNVDASHYQAIEVRLANGTRVRDAQLFYAGQDGGIAEERSARWTLEQTNDAVTYRIELEGRPGWQGPISRLRLDPVGVGDGGEIRIEWIRLVPREDGKTRDVRQET